MGSLPLKQGKHRWDSAPACDQHSEHLAGAGGVLLVVRPVCCREGTPTPTLTCPALRRKFQLVPAPRTKALARGRKQRPVCGPHVRPCQRSQGPAADLPEWTERGGWSAWRVVLILDTSKEQSEGKAWRVITGESPPLREINAAGGAPSGRLKTRTHAF